MTIVDVYLNRRGVNTIEISAREAPVDAGSDLVIRLRNSGSPTHATVRTQNGQAFTDFFHENIYVDGDVEYRIPVRESSGDGVFDLEFITGYGSRTTRMKVVVSKACPVIIPQEEEIVVEDEYVMRKMPHMLTLIPCIIACITYLVWLSFRGAILAPVDAFITVFIILLLLIGVVTACRSPESSW
ncbi:hypothetical protein FTO68_09550 [Methanocalculus taiwanensis]|uniref:Uncharacterized protein n=1 Tax=Methanocalculus taiwanensis TaxID=106207 RepID=A0ABD4TLP8_9EURY|nr:hypothetical protein [Methanocalculus taiwanensis]MCQ1539222.1 hypothetical protein [Methanocalculus taiwanensis]